MVAGASSMKIYRGWRDRHEGGRVTVVDGDNAWPLDPRLDLMRHAPAGFGWGNTDAGAAQLALALLADATGDDPEAARLHQDYKWAVVKTIRGASWEMTAESVVNWAKAHPPPKARQAKML